MRAQTDTRARIQEVALQLFTEQGYEATSLREIAESLGVTKAALYYHFKTKEDIVASLAEDRQAVMERLIAWAQGLPRTIETRREFIRRYADEVHSGRHHAFMRFMERNQTALRGHPKFDRMRDMMNTLSGLMWDEDATTAQRLRTSMAIFTLHAAWFVLKDEKIPDEERKQAALDLALDLLESARPTGS
ncbi:TetR family transcriptional regulator [Sphaerisporangium melleum]|uniref:TetR family transcriptional regulator n=1 Tax=Sphaerisporangium melleum TaxID=321316 RepID=A0A917VKF7_9ACTN|nr:TetR/AcrR family transcriptional regulator [Sphaerisporangium melleum]GGK89916.1 TetR family transcriptional regulator [Sphaerisporangium melleum]GII72555.1 TetR family transcriptional regulator [Sphaerisporangium melleum]